VSTIHGALHEQKLILWQSLLKEEDRATKYVNLSELEDWAERANNSRCIRNRYIHGNWQILSSHLEKPITLSTPPWWRVKEGTEVHEKMSLDELESTADELESIFREFMRIRQHSNV